MMGLTLTQPWASLIAVGEKRVETRSWATPYRGPVAIHAAKGLAEPVCNEDGLREYVAADPYAEALGRHGYVVAEELPRAAIVAVVNIVACLPTNNLGTAMKALPELADFETGEFERQFGDYGPGRFAWLLEGLHRIDPPIPYRGAQKLWEIPEDEMVVGIYNAHRS